MSNEGYVDRCDAKWKSHLFKREYYPGNNYYGVGEILRRYAGLPPYFPLNCKIQHGVKFFTHYASPQDCPSHFAFYTSSDPSCLFLAFDGETAAFFHDHGVKNVTAVGSAAVYLDEHLDFLRKKHPNPKGTIAFPCKSSTHVDVLMDLDAYARMLQELPEKYQPVKVCLYYKDLEKGRDKPFLERGMRVVGNGTLHSQDFLYNFFKNVADCEYAVSNDHLSSSNYYSIYYGLKYFLYGPKVEGFQPKRPADAQYGEERVLGDAICPFSFSMEQCEDQQAQRKIAEQVLGRSHKLSPRAMRRLLLTRLSPSFLARYAASLGFKRFRRSY